MVFEKLQEIVADKLGIEAEEVKLESSLKDDLEADSLDIVDIVMSIEEEFEVTIESEDEEHIKTIADVVKLIETKQK
ncbi:acyl carrier protein [Candidatus Epulonipiscium viviparus]|uniref:acyl carrier protein n=1 Tax=Candidatus Epulonipiscium viviparus TaxID=420336 RepID=UPI00016BFF32|nr:acyl carrier protein [Candidatus Epulopiscium viviparus]